MFVTEKRGVVKAFDSLDDATATTVIDLRTDTMNVSERTAGAGRRSRPRPYVYQRATPTSGEPLRSTASPGADNDACADATAGCVVSGRLARLRPDPATDLPVGSPTVLVDGWCRVSSHTVGDLRFGPDGMLYASAGEGASSTTPTTADR